MITYSITSKRLPSDTSSRNTVDHADPTTEEGQLKIFRRASKLAKKIFTKGMRVQLIGSRDTGIITFIHYDIHAVQWNNGKPLFIEVTLDGSEKCYICSVSQLKRIK